ncbi:hypothetical protein MIMGU_mgv1a023542mg [Erythranthe guttata]|uniref:Thaumatin-like protein 1 n=1 Tax=Erythranthe guttata TaxID=4155 RepID=A0A022QF06_ERYGU|nr:PREDICTED: pathogenesis-related protein 5-like [Erythranthe guttata]EYU26189.1 hypothetical protein MIMGU_mgv1a023542mg [Erythranthe guttata]|eukprot:XP_012850796.1 PREDICTED: pathogenesis-related protein 5-like [Erythranthe guttata]
MASSSYTIVFILLLHIFQRKGGVVKGATFTFVNKCSDTIWPAILGSPKLETTGFHLSKDTSRAVQAPTGWSGRFWARTGCTFDDSGRGSCSTGDCGSGEMECNGAGATAATLAEFTLGSGSIDFYDVSLVDGYNLPVLVEAAGGSGQCASTGCAEDLNQSCPPELMAEGGGACRSACGAFGTPEYCCKGEYGSPATCRPSEYSEMFKSACPKSYSYAYDDVTSTFTCTAADYVITFCPSLPSGKSSKSDNGMSDGSGSESGSGSGSVEEAMLADGSWLAELAIGGESATTHPFGATAQALVALFTVLYILLQQ